MNTEAEKLEVYYRTSDRQEFSLLGVITPELVIENVNKRIDMENDVPLPMQRYQFTKLSDGETLPDFNEIQFKFVSYNGFSIIGCWFEYEYITHITKK